MTNISLSKIWRQIELVRFEIVQNSIDYTVWHKISCYQKIITMTDDASGIKCYISNTLYREFFKK